MRILNEGSSIHSRADKESATKLKLSILATSTFLVGNFSLQFAALEIVEVHEFSDCNERLNLYTVLDSELKNESAYGAQFYL